jgi:hypothetical protein
MVLSLLRRFVAQPNRRLEPREARIAGRISLGGREYPLKDWSRRGFSALGVRAEHYPGDRIALAVEIELAAGALSFDCSAVVVWVDRERQELAGVFTELDHGIQDKILRALLAGCAEPQGRGSPQQHA